MATTNAQVNLTTVQNVGALQKYASQGAYAAAKGSAAAEGDIFYNTTDGEVQFHNGSAWVDLLIPANVVSYWIAQSGQTQSDLILANQVFS